MKYSRILLPLVFGALAASAAVAQSAPTVVSLSPNSGTGATQTFSVVVNDPSGAADLNNMQLLFNTTASRFSACNVSYDAYTNTIGLYNDAGTGFVGTVTAGLSAQVSNYRCTLSGAGSSFSTSGNNATLTVALRFSGTFTGQQNAYAYVQGYDGLNNGGWQMEGTWTLPAQPPEVEWLAPKSGSGSTQTFTMVVKAPSGLNNIQLLFNTTATRAGGCNVSYDGLNTISLYNDAGSGFVGAVTLGSSQQVSNSQCTLNGIGSSTYFTGDQVLNVALTFSTSFQGLKNVYAYVQGNDGLNNGGWQQEGTWPDPGHPSVVSLTPSSGTGGTQTFTVVVNDPNSALLLNNIQLLFNTTATRAGGCNVSYDGYTNTLSLYNNAGTGFAPGVGSPGSAALLSNTQCALNIGESWYSTSGTTATLTLALTFSGTFTGQQNAYVYAQGNDGLNNGGWALEGTWVPLGQLPSVVSLTPSFGGGATQSFSVVVDDPSGATDLNNIQLLFNTTATRADGCNVSYDVYTNTLSLYNNAGTGIVGGVTPGSSTQVSNGQCTVSGTGSSYSASGNTATLALALTFSGSFVVQKNVYAYIQGNDGLNNGGWALEGTWATSDGPFVVSLSPKSSVGMSQVFTVVVNDPKGPLELNNIQLLFNTTASRLSACNVSYDVFTYTMSLYNDAGTGFVGGVIPGSSAQVSNSQCTLSGPGSSFSFSGNNVTLTVALAFSATFTGQQTAYVYAQGNDGLNNGGWEWECTWMP